MIIRTAAHTLALAAVLVVLAGCAPAAPTATPEPAACDVQVVINFGPLEEPGVEACAGEGAATDILAAAGVQTEGTVDYGDQVICRVNGRPSADEQIELEGVAPFVEPCVTFNDFAYWALWVKNDADAEWEYAQEGVTTLELSAGQAIGLVYTPIDDVITPD